MPGSLDLSARDYAALVQREEAHDFVRRAICDDTEANDWAFYVRRSDDGDRIHLTYGRRGSDVFQFEIPWSQCSGFDPSDIAQSRCEVLH